MPRYHFNVRAPEGAIVDADGAEFDSADDAYRAAVRTAHKLMLEDNDAEWLHCVFEITDPDGHVVFELPFADSVEPRRASDVVDR